MAISIDDYRIELNAYNGPLDLLLYLVKRHEIDLYDIPIAELTQQYLDHLKMIEQIDVELAGEFLVMAATLLEVKSQMLLPRAGLVEEADGETEDSQMSGETDPRYELVQQLLAYKRFKDAATALNERREQWAARFTHQPTRLDASAQDGESAARVEFDLDDMQVFDLCQAFARILDSIGRTSAHEVVYDDTPIALHAEDILDRLKRDGQGGSMTLKQIFVGRSSQSEMIGLFLAVLELVHQCNIRVKQGNIGGEICLELVPEAERQQFADDGDADWRDPNTGEMQYEWPSEEARLHAESRAKRIAERLARIRDGEKLEDDPDDVFVASDDEGRENDDDSSNDETKSLTDE